jgi:hypothetical protein
VITAAAKSAIGLRKVGSGKLKGWWNKGIAAAIRRRRHLYKQYQSDINDAGARLLLAEQRALVKRMYGMIKQAKETYMLDAALKVNRAFA